MVAMEHFVQTAVRICRGAQPADKTAEKVAKIVHCLVCEERSVVPNSNHPFDAAECLVCECSSTTTTTTTSTTTPRGRNRILLGPVWCGPIFDAEFVTKMEAFAGRYDPSTSGGRKRKDKKIKSRDDDDAKVDGDVESVVDNDKNGKSNGNNDDDGTTLEGISTTTPFSVKTREIIGLLKAEAQCADSAAAAASAARGGVSSTNTIDGDEERRAEKAAREAVDDVEVAAVKRRRISGSLLVSSSSATSMATGGNVGGGGGGGGCGDGGLSLSSVTDSRSSENLRILSDGEPLFYYNTHQHLPKGEVYFIVTEIEGI